MEERIMEKAPTPYSDAVGKFNELVGKKAERVKVPKSKQALVHRIGVFSDFHAPHHDIAAISKALQDASRRGVTQAILAGDIGDGYAFSRFLHTKPAPPEEELAAIAAILRIFSESFAAVWVIKGNHDVRAMKYFARTLPPEFLPLVQHDLLKLAAADLPNVSFPSVAIGGQELTWLCQIGDLIVGHPETHSIVPGKAPDKFCDWLLRYERRGLLPRFNVVAMGHTHQAGGPLYRADGVALYETGCLCKLQDYSVQPDIRYRPQTQAYLYVEQRDGLTDVNQSQLVRL
jgi:predicted phosphodiesterase